MLNEELSKRIEYAMTLEPSIEVADALNKYGMYAHKKDGEVGEAKRCWARAKEMLSAIIRESTNGGTWIQLDEWCIEHNVESPLIDKYYEILKSESEFDFESYIFYMERDRKPDKRFYSPRMDTLRVAMRDLCDLDDGILRYYGLSLPARVGKSTLCIFFLSWVACKRPNSHSAMCGHSGILAKAFFHEMQNILFTPEYRFKELFDYMHPEYADKRFPAHMSAEDLTITLGDPDRFATFTARGIDGTWTGAIDISCDGYLYVDDLVRDREHSLSPTRMENTWQALLNKCVDRENDGARELFVGTLWSIIDPIERMRVLHEHDDGYRFRRIPALDENDESNFQYRVNGFSTQYYRDMRDRLDDPEWQAKYQQRPYVREGLLFPIDELRYFNGILPEGDSRVVAVVDVAWGGGDSLSMPIGREYDNGDVYIFDWVFSKGTKESTIPTVVGKIVDNEIRQVRFEGNAGGELYSVYVEDQLRSQNYKCSCTEKKAPTRMSKVEKIIAHSGDIKRKFVFLMPKGKEADEDAGGVKRYVRSAEYQKAMDELGMFVTVGKNEHDDAPDSLTQLDMFVSGEGTAKVEAIVNPFKGMGGFH